MKRLFIALLTIIFLLSINLVTTGCFPEDPVKPTKEDGDGTEPDKPPPPPPPPPPGTMLGSNYSTLEVTTESIVQKVLQGEYGQPLQKILADEIAKCIDQMEDEGVISITPDDETPVIQINTNGQNSVSFNSAYIIDDIMDGKYGMGAKEILRDLMKNYRPTG